MADSLLDSDSDFHEPRTGPTDADTVHSSKRSNDTDPITCERIDPTRHVSISSPDGTVVLRYNTSTLRKVAMAKGQWMQPPHFRSPMTDELREMVERVEGTLVLPDPVHHGPESDEEEDLAFDYQDTFQTLLDLFNRRNSLQRRDVYICPRCFDYAARNIYRPPSRQLTLDEAIQCARSNADTCQGGNQGSAVSSSSSSSSSTASHNNCEVRDTGRERAQEDKHSAEPEAANANPGEADNADESQSSSSSSTSNSSSSSSSSTERSDDDSSPEKGDSSETEDDASSVSSEEEYRRSFKLLHDERMKYSAAKQAIEKAEASSGVQDPRKYNPMRVLTALSEDELQKCAFINAKKWKAHLDQFHHDTAMLSSEDHKLRQFINAYIARYQQRCSSIHAFWKKDAGWYAFLFNCLYDVVSREGPPGALLDERQDEPSGSSEADSDDWLVADDHVSSDEEEEEDDEENSTPPITSRMAHQKVSQKKEKACRDRPSKGQKRKASSAGQTGAKHVKRLHKVADTASSESDTPFWEDSNPPIQVAENSSSCGPRRQPLRHCRHKAAETTEPSTQQKAGKPGRQASSKTQVLGANTTDKAFQPQKGTPQKKRRAKPNAKASQDAAHVTVLSGSEAEGEMGKGPTEQRHQVSVPVVERRPTSTTGQVHAFSHLKQTKGRLKKVAPKPPDDEDEEVVFT